ncbi:MAG: hypothetical protein NC048_02785 [Bacteroides sp.]|nr:hypothetical protein [Bacteroides sp.]MCM1531434.1 hypothetical protein [Ruminococcus flavefaciens]MCM1554404.1 hypothetical protein [Bacteroides sp.]
MNTIHTTREELTTIVRQTVESVIDRHLRIMYANARMYARCHEPKLSPVGLLVGLDQICAVLRCSIPTARKKLDTLLKPAVLSGRGQKYVVDGDLMMRILQNTATRHRKKLQQATRPATPKTNIS